MKNTIPEVQFSRSTSAIRTESQRESLYRKSAIRTGILNTLAALAATACVDDPGTFKPGREVTAAISADSGSTETADTSSTTADTSSAGETADAGTAEDGTSVDTTPAEKPDTNQPIDTGITPDIKADTGTKTDSDSFAPTPDVQADTQKTDVKVYKSAPPDQTLSEFKEGMELPVQQVFVVTKGKVYDAYEGFGHKWGVTPWNKNFLKTVNGADVYTLKVADLPQDPAVAGKGNFRVVAVSLPEGTKAGTYIDSITGEVAQDGKTPIFDRAPLIPVHCPGVYSGEDAKLLVEAITMTGKMEFNQNLEMLRDTLAALLQQNINIAFANSGKSYAPQCTVQAVTPGDVKIVDGQVCTIGCLIGYVSGQPIAKWTQQIGQK